MAVDSSGVFLLARKLPGVRRRPVSVAPNTSYVYEPVTAPLPFVRSAVEPRPSYVKYVCAPAASVAEMRSRS